MGEVPVLEHRGSHAVAVGRHPRLPGATLPAVRTGRRGRATRSPALAAVRQPQADELHRDLSFHADVRDQTPTRRCSRSSASVPRRRGACSTRTSTGREFAAADRLDDRGPLALRLPVLGGRARRRLARQHPAIADWLGRIRAQPRWVAPYALMPGHPLPGREVPRIAQCHAMPDAPSMNVARSVA